MYGDNQINGDCSMRSKRIGSTSRLENTDTTNASIYIYYRSQIADYATIFDTFSEMERVIGLYAESVS